MSMKKEGYCFICGWALVKEERRYYIKGLDIKMENTEEVNLFCN
jgi:hypothetical protein